jgi:hypothetical protein
MPSIPNIRPVSDLKNNPVFYVIKKDTIEIHCILYSRRNLGAILNAPQEK